jgi:hypothetical protein
MMRWRNMMLAQTNKTPTEEGAGGGGGAGGGTTIAPVVSELHPSNTYVAPTVLPATPSTLMQKLTTLIQSTQSPAPVVTPAAPVSTSPIQQLLQKAVAAVQNIQSTPSGSVSPIQYIQQVASQVSSPAKPVLQPVSAPALDYGVVYYNTPVPSTAPKAVVPAAYTDPGLDSVVKSVTFESTAVPSATYQDPLISSSGGTELAKTEPLPAVNKSGMVLLGIGALGLLLLLVRK